MSDRLRDLQWFLQVVDLGGFSAAARRLGAPQSSVSRAVQTLEEELGAALFARTTRRVVPTEAGLLLAERARALLAFVAETEELVGDAHALPRGVVHLSIPTNYGRHRVIPALPTLLATYPQLEVRIRFQDRSVDLLEDGVDVAVRVGGDDGAGAASVRLGETVRKIVATPAWVATWGAPQTADELADRPFVVFLRGGEPVPLQVGGEVVPVRGPVALGDLDAVVAMVRAGLGAAQLPCFLVADALASGELVPIAAHLWPAPTPVRALWRSGARSARVRAVVEHLRASLAEGPPSGRSRVHDAVHDPGT